MVNLRPQIERGAQSKQARWYFSQVQRVTSTLTQLNQGGNNMGNFGQCDFGAITPELVLRSLLSGITAGVSCGLRFVEVNVGGKTMTKPGGCASFEDLFTLFQRSLMIADDGVVAIRSTSITNGVGENHMCQGYAVGVVRCEDEDGRDL